jgi:hypothetical protein
MPSGEKVDGIGGRREYSSLKSLRRLAEEV